MADPRQILFCLFLFGVAAVSAECPETFERHGTQCYKIFMTRATWLDGIRFCRLQGSQLLSIQSESEQHTIDGMISRIRGALASGYFWVGGGDMFNEGVFSWFYEDGQTEQVSGYTNWARNQPSNSGGYENCMGMDFSGHAYWNDRDCNDLRYPICETTSV